MQTWAYLDKETYQKFITKAQSLGMSEGELTQLLIKNFLQTPIGESKDCSHCRYYWTVNNGGIQLLMKANEFLSLVEPQYKRLVTNR